MFWVSGVITDHETPGMQHTRSLHSTHPVCSTPDRYDMPHTRSHVHITYSKRTHLVSLLKNERAIEKTYNVA